jgi:hypothetical protein
VFASGNLTGWSIVGTTAAAVDSSSIPPGLNSSPFAMAISPASLAAVGQGPLTCVGAQVMAVAAVIAADPGTLIGAWEVQLIFYDAAGNVLGVPYVVASGNGGGTGAGGLTPTWESFSGSVTVPAGAATAVFNVFQATTWTAGRVYIDSASLKNSAGNGELLSSALAGVDFHSLPNFLGAQNAWFGGLAAQYALLGAVIAGTLEVTGPMLASVLTVISELTIQSPDGLTSINIQNGAITISSSNGFTTTITSSGVTIGKTGGPSCTLSGVDLQFSLPGGLHQKTIGGGSNGTYPARSFSIFDMYDLLFNSATTSENVQVAGTSAGQIITLKYVGGLYTGHSVSYSS